MVKPIRKITKKKAIYENMTDSQIIDKLKNEKRGLIKSRRQIRVELKKRDEKIKELERELSLLR